ncbi:hypothetical protein [Nioella sp.]|uniref:hypothetical protein n=1 Tax=Nioella sp. TaxID=1912091 RepID=UPI000FDA76F3
MNRNRAARTQHEPGAARTGKTEDRTGRGVHPTKSARDTDEAARQPQKRIRREGQAEQPGAQADAMASISAAQVQWLEMIRALARAAAQADHDASTRTTGRPVSQND